MRPARINSKWLKPMPSWYWDFSFRDGMQEEIDLTPRCVICGSEFQPPPRGGHRKVCFDPGCMKAKERKRSAARRLRQRAERSLKHGA